MEWKEQVSSVLVVSAAAHFNSSLQAMLAGCPFEPVQFEESVSAARRRLLDRDFDLVIVNAPLPDDTGLRFAIDLCRDKNGVALLLVRTELYASTYEKAAEHGVYILPKPTSRAILLQALDWMVITCRRLRRLEKKTVSIEEKMQEIRLVNRAKWLLIERMQMTEADAHRYIEKQAMDNCVSRREIAEKIIQMYA